MYQPSLLWRGLREHLYRSLAGCLGPLDVNLFGSLRHVGQNDDFVWQNVHKAAVDGKIVFLVVILRAQFALRQLCDEGYVVRQDTQLPVNARREHHIYFPTV